MKKITLSLLAIFAFSGVTFAQTPDIKLGAKAGLNISTVSDLDDSKSRTGFHVGALAEIFINEKFSVQPEILYSTQGAKSSNLGGLSYKLTLDYLNIPIMAKYYVMDGLSVQAGPQIGFNVKAEMERKLLGEKETKDIKDEINTVDFGLNFGAGYELPIGLFFDARYNLGFTKIHKEGDSTKNRVFQLSVGYKF
ncbi:porin family protein [Myroides odoratus]|uniref:porin family protein n=1 Tax=Myroides odoratus TaxID=256 RepID=UPI0039AFAA02